MSADNGGFAEAGDWESFFEARPPRRLARGPRQGNGAAPAESFTTTATPTVSTLALRTAIAQIAEAQLERWRAGATVLLETDPWAKEILRHDYWTNLGITDPATRFGTPTWWNVPWSAAFVMACASKAQTALQLPTPVLGHATLSLNAAHAAYCWQAFRDRTARTRRRYWAYRPADALIEVGDIVAKSRGTVTVADAWTAVQAAAYGGFIAHGDIVVRVDGANARVIGGNVSNSVTRTSYALTAEGLIDTAQAANDANRVFAVLKPEGAPFWGRLTGMIL
jgi:hypothetical protein